VVGKLANLARDIRPQRRGKVVASTREHYKAGTGYGLRGGPSGTQTQDGVLVAMQDKNGLAQLGSLGPCQAAPTCLLCASLSRGPLSTWRSNHSRAASSLGMAMADTTLRTRPATPMAFSAPRQFRARILLM